MSCGFTGSQVTRPTTVRPRAAAGGGVVLRFVNGNVSVITSVPFLTQNDFCRVESSENSLYWTFTE